MALNGKTALVTGGAVRIGRGIALALAGRGVRVAVHYGSSADAAAETVASLRAIGVAAEAFQADLRQVARVEALVEAVAGHFGTIDILVNSAAIFLPGGIRETTEQLWDDHFATNLKAPFFLCRAFARHLDGRPGDIVNIADWRAIRPRPDHLAYTLTKNGIMAMTQALALALAPAVRVNAIAPGAILPPPGRDDAYLERVATGVPLRRPGSVQDVCEAALYLLESGYLTGQTIFVDGGEHL